MIAVFFDSSVLISGIASSKGASHLLLSLCKKKKIRGYVSSIIVQEVIRNLKRKFSQKQLIEFLEFLAKSNLGKVDFESESEIKNLHVIAGAYKAKAQYLVTLDKKHLLSLPIKNLPFKIVSPKQLLQVIPI